MSASAHSALSVQLQFVCGKGGVGKSVVAVALARAFAARGERVLLVQVNAVDSHAALLGCEPVTDAMREVAPSLSVVNITPGSAMKEYALMTLRYEAVYRAVFENRMTRVFLRFVPALQEMVVLGKIWFHAEEKLAGPQSEARYTRIIVDTPATGHGLKLLRVARQVNEAAGVGPMADKTAQMAELVEDPTRCALHVVTLPEELPVNEATTLCAAARADAVAALGVCFVNQLSPVLMSDAVAEAVERLKLHDVGVVRELAAFGAARVQREQSEAHELLRTQTLGIPVVTVPRLQALPLTPQHVDDLSRLLDRTALAPGGG